MKAIYKITLIGLTAFGSLTVEAQQVPMYTHYMYNTLVVNPAYAGSREALTVTALSRSQWVNFEGAPLTQTLTIHTPLRNQHIGLGLALMQDKIGPVKTTSITADFAYIMQLTRKARLAFGLSAGANMFQANLNTLNLDQQNDPVFANNINNKITPDVGFGIYYSRERFYAGLSTPNLLENNYSKITEGNGSTLIGIEQRHVFFIAGTVLKLSDNFLFKPTTLIKITAGAPVQADLTASFIILKRFLAGAMIRSGDAVGGLIGFDITEKLHIGYSYDFSYGLSTAKYNQGSHEILLRYDFLLFDKKQVHTPRYF
ncbi:MAG: type IX secretion system membrane protein PorP/SprF [Bacteroidia bacterium]|jgi:type IX secretion system PorP/SprF family membrane protein